MFPLAYADTFDPTQSNLIFILIAGGGIAVAAALVAVILFFARRTASRRGQLLRTAALLWGVIAVGGLLYITLQQLAWQKQFQQDLMSGYGDPNAVGPAPHVGLWVSLAAIYVLLLACAASIGKSS